MFENFLLLFSWYRRYTESFEVAPINSIYSLTLKLTWYFCIVVASRFFVVPPNQTRDAWFSTWILIKAFASKQRRGNLVMGRPNTFGPRSRVPSRTNSSDDVWATRQRALIITFRPVAPTGGPVKRCTRLRKRSVLAADYSIVIQCSLLNRMYEGKEVTLDKVALLNGYQWTPR